MSNSRSGTGDEQEEPCAAYVYCQDKKKQGCHQNLWNCVSGNPDTSLKLPFQWQWVWFSFTQFLWERQTSAESQPRCQLAEIPPHGASSDRSWHWGLPQPPLLLLAEWARTLSRGLLAVKTPSWQGMQHQPESAMLKIQMLVSSLQNEK